MDDGRNERASPGWIDLREKRNCEPLSSLLLFCASLVPYHTRMVETCLVERQRKKIDIKSYRYGSIQLGKVWMPAFGENTNKKVTLPIVR